MYLVRGIRKVEFWRDVFLISCFVVPGAASKHNDSKERTPSTKDTVNGERLFPFPGKCVSDPTGNFLAQLPLLIGRPITPSFPDFRRKLDGSRVKLGNCNADASYASYAESFSPHPT